MSYHATFQLQILNKDELEKETIDRIKEEIENLNIFEQYYDDVWSACSMSWTYCVEDMCDISAKIPEAIFHLSVYGEDSYEDIWDAYFLGGKYQIVIAEIVRGEFDPEKLFDPKEQNNGSVK